MGGALCQTGPQKIGRALRFRSAPSARGALFPPAGGSSAEMARDQGIVQADGT